jgi:glutamate dehydrogenase/leucine dehydrogenase
VIRADNVDQVKARLIVQGANIPVTEEAEVVLHQCRRHTPPRHR